jgi:hypothetical protein
MSRSPWNFRGGDPVSEVFQAGVAATSGAAVVVNV